MTVAPAIDPPPELGGLGAVIRDAREQRGMRQRDLAAAVHVGLSSVSGWERGTQSPSAAVLPLLAQALGVTLEVDADGFEAVDPAPAPVSAPAPQVVVVVAGTAEAMREALDRLGVPRAE
jgi:transcriptional regulator with XRE-family HTH domain